MQKSTADVIGLDWRCDMGVARQTLKERCVQGNVDPSVLLGPQSGIEQAVQDCMRAAGSQGHILNVGDGVTPNIPEENVGYFISLATQSKTTRSKTDPELAIAMS